MRVFLAFVLCFASDFLCALAVSRHAEWVVEIDKSVVGAQRSHAVPAFTGARTRLCSC